MEKIKSFEEFISESNSTSAVTEQISKLLFSCVYESETGEVIVSVNEGFVKDLQMHIRATIDALIELHGVKNNKIDKELESNLALLTSSFQAGDTPEETAAKIAEA